MSVSTYSSPASARPASGWRWLAWSLALAFAMAIPFIFKTSFFLTIASQIGVAIIFALSFNLMFGVTGMLWFAQAIFYGAAAYSVIYFLKAMEAGSYTFVPVVLIPGLGIIVGLVVGAVIGLVATRRAGLVFAMISLGFSELVRAFSYIFISLSGGEQGLSGDRTYGAPFFGWTFAPQIQVYYLILAWCVLAICAYLFFMRTPLGRIALAVRDNPERVSFVGYNVRHVRWLLFTISAGFAGMAGALHALNYEHVGTTTLGLETSALVLFMVVIGGTGNVIGPILGAMLITLIYSVVSQFTSVWVLYVGLLFIFVVMYFPQGIAGIISSHAALRFHDGRRLQRLALSYAAFAIAAAAAAFAAVALIELAFARSAATTGTTASAEFFRTISNSLGLHPWLFYPLVLAIALAAGRLLLPSARSAWLASTKGQENAG